MGWFYQTVGLSCQEAPTRPAYVVAEPSATLTRLVEPDRYSQRSAERTLPTGDAVSDVAMLASSRSWPQGAAARAGQERCDAAATTATTSGTTPPSTAAATHARVERGTRPEAAEGHPAARPRARQPARTHDDRRVRLVRVPCLRRCAPGPRAAGDRPLRPHRQGEPRVPWRCGRSRIGGSRSDLGVVGGVGAAPRVGLPPARLSPQPRGHAARDVGESPAKLADALGLDAAGLGTDAGRPEWGTQVGRRRTSPASSRMSTFPVFLAARTREAGSPVRRPDAARLVGCLRRCRREGAEGAVDGLARGTVEFCRPFG